MVECCCGCIAKMNWKTFMDIVQTVTCVITMIFTILIPVFIMNFTNYTNLTIKYMDAEIGQAIQAVVDFFYDDCNCDVSLINQMYLHRYYADKNLDGNKPTLHNQRRLLTDFYCELEMCRKSSLLLKHKIKRDWTSKEAWIIKILIHMNNAVQEEGLMKDISSVKYEKIHRPKGINSYLNKLSEVLEKSDTEMR